MLDFDIEHAALLSMDMQAGIVASLVQDPGFVERAGGVLAVARRRGVRVMHVKVGFRPGLPEINPRNRMFAMVKSNPQFREMLFGPGGEIHAAVAPIEGEAVIVKHRVSAFTGTDLDMMLRAQEIDTLVLMGVATSGVVLSTLLDATDADYRVFVVRDCCCDRDAAVHDMLMDIVFKPRAGILTAAELVSSQ